MALIELSVENLAVLSKVRLALDSGFTVVTGETGAGKSLIVDALALVLGARASSEQVRSGESTARVAAVFDGLPAESDDPLGDVVDAGDGTLIVRREIGADGRSAVRVNDRPVTVGALAALGGRLAEIHGQHEQQRLLRGDRQLELLDRAGDLGALRSRVEGDHRAWRAAAAAAAEMMSDPRELARRVELLEFQRDEIAAANIAPDEDATLEAQVRAAQHAEEIAGRGSDAIAALRGERGAAESAHLAAAALRAAAQHDLRFAALAERAAGVAAEAEELGRDVEAAADSVDLDPRARAAAEERLTLIYELKRKYGATLDEVIAFGRDAAAELAAIADQAASRDRLRAEESASRTRLERSAAELSAARAAAAESLAERVNAELPPLGLPAGAFGVALQVTEVGPSGADRAEFTFAPNPGEPPRPFGRIASGGEASRLSLALKVVLAAADDTPVLVFDEVDAGVGGRNAAALGERLRALARHHQVLCVTHLPQLAAYADHHVHVGKRVEGGRTHTELRTLRGPERTRELAAMLAGAGAGDEAQAAAEALLRSAR